MKFVQPKAEVEEKPVARRVLGEKPSRPQMETP